MFVAAVDKEQVKVLKHLFELGFREGKPVTLPDNADFQTVGGLLKLYLYSLPVPVLAMGPNGLDVFYAAAGWYCSTCYFKHFFR